MSYELDNIADASAKIGAENNLLKLDEPSQPVCVETGLLGQTLATMNHGHCLFSGLRFQTTSYNHNGTLFFLVVSVFAYQLQEP